MTVMMAALSWEQALESSPSRQFKFTVPKCVSVTQGIWGRALAKSLVFSSKGKEPRAADMLFCISPPTPSKQPAPSGPWTDQRGFCQIKTLFSTPSSLQVGLVTHLEGHFHHPPIQMQTLITSADGGDVSGPGFWRTFLNPLSMTKSLAFNDGMAELQLRVSHASGPLQLGDNWEWYNKN